MHPSNPCQTILRDSSWFCQSVRRSVGPSPSVRRSVRGGSVGLSACLCLSVSVRPSVDHQRRHPDQPQITIFTSTPPSPHHLSDGNSCNPTSTAAESLLGAPRAAPLPPRAQSRRSPEQRSKAASDGCCQIAAFCEERLARRCCELWGHGFLWLLDLSGSSCMFPNPLALSEPEPACLKEWNQDSVRSQAKEALLAGFSASLRKS